ncbi:MAG: TetR/AcrR family transcriptional regulator [Rhodococcus sp. (in: high G+C Gram-positive bacteria)]
MTATPQRRRTSTEARILQATTTLLSDGQRYAELPVERILQLAKVSRSTFYQWFPDKTALIQRVARPGVEEFLAASDSWWTRSDGGSADTLADIVTQMLALARASAPIWRAYLETASSDSEFGATLREATETYTRKMAARLDRERHDGLVPAEVDTSQTARFIVTTMRASFIEALTAGHTTEDERFARTLGRVFWLSMYRPIAP